MNNPFIPSAARAEAGRRAAYAATAGALGVPADRFGAAMSASFPARIVGRYGDTRATVPAIARECGLEPDARLLDTAVAVQRAAAERVRPPARAPSTCSTGCARAVTGPA